jgi:hypothetical protein
LTLSIEPTNFKLHEAWSITGPNAFEKDIPGHDQATAVELRALQIEDSEPCGLMKFYLVEIARGDLPTRMVALIEQAKSLVWAGP